MSAKYTKLCANMTHKSRNLALLSNSQPFEDIQQVFEDLHDTLSLMEEPLEGNLHADDGIKLDLENCLSSNYKI